MKTVFCFIALICVTAWSADAPVPQRSKAEMLKLVETEGATTPPWFAAQKVNYPPTLLIHWERPKDKEPWTPSKYLGQYIWSVINENPGRWKEGLRFLYFVLEQNKDNKENFVTTQKAIARHYQNLLNDPLRAAYWWRQAGVETDPDDALPLGICYAKLGCRELARKIAEDAGEDTSRHGYVIKLWADIGEYDKALKIAEIKAEKDDMDVAYLMAGETCRLKGDIQGAIGYYEKALKADAKKSGRDNKQTLARAQASLDALKLYDAFDLKKIPDGSYSADSYGYSGQVYVTATVKGNKITDVKVTKHTEKQFYGSLTETPAKIIAKQTVKGIDTFASATITSEAIINAAAKALGKGAQGK